MFPKCTGRDTFSCFQNVPAETRLHVSKVVNEEFRSLFTLNLKEGCEGSKHY